MTEDDGLAATDSPVERRLRLLEEGARRAAAALADHQARLERVESWIRGRRNVERLEAAER